MLIRVSGYNSGVKEYLEDGVKNGRDYTRDELDERIILDGDLSLTEMVYQSIPDKGQDRYDTITLAFREDEIPEQTLRDVTREFKEFFMYAYHDDEINFYAEAHIPKIAHIENKRTGELIDRKPHIHIVIPKVNLLSGQSINPVGSSFKQSEKYLEAFQEYINQKYNLASPREHIRVDPTNAADVLSRYKGDDFRGKNKEFKQQLIRDIVENDFTSRDQFYNHVAKSGEIKIRNAGKDNEYLAVKLPGDAKFTNLKETIFQDDFVINRQLKKPPLDKKIIQKRLSEWPLRSKEIKYVSKATPSFRKIYKESTPAEKLKLLAERQSTFYKKHGGKHGELYAEREGSHQHGINQAGIGGHSKTTNGMQSLSRGDVATDRQSGQTPDPLLLPGNALLYLGQQDAGRNSGLRHSVSGRRGRHPTDHFDQYTRIPGVSSLSERLERRGFRLRDSGGAGIDIPVYALNPRKLATTDDIHKRTQQLSGTNRKSPTTPRTARLLKRLIPRSPRNASFTANSFLKRHEKNQILPQHRREIRAVDTLFFSARRNIVTDNRLTQKEKQQYVSVLTFERMKAHQAIQHPTETPIHQEYTMGSADIRRILKESRTPENSISAPQDETRTAKSRFTRIVNTLNTHLDEKHTEKQQRRLTAGDLYTKRAKLSQNVHYRDKKSDRTMFVDTGKAIALRKDGMTESAVAVALELAKEKFGSTLQIKGSADFKQQVIEAVARNGMDVHFTDKDMNKQLKERQAELAIEKEGQRIETPEQVTPEKTAEVASTETAATSETERSSTEAEYDDPLTPEERQEGMDEAEMYEMYQAMAEQDAQHQGQDKERPGKEKRHGGVLLEHGAAPYKFKPDPDKPKDEQRDSYYVKLQMDNGKTRTLWGVDLERAVNDMQPGDKVRLEDMGKQQVTWTETDKQGQTVERSGQRTVWEGTVTERAMEQNTRTQSSPAPQREHDQDGLDFA